MPLQTFFREYVKFLLKFGFLLVEEELAETFNWKKLCDLKIRRFGEDLLVSARVK